MNGEDVYWHAARAHHQLSREAPNYEDSLRWLATQQQFRWAVDAACRAERARIVAALRGVEEGHQSYGLADLIERGEL